MPSFVHPALLWALPLVGVPVLIHLINMMRHRRVEWAAMEFLLASQKRNRTWVLLRQFLLLAARMAAVALLVLAVAQPLVQGRLGSLLAARKNHHVVLLDDSYSMSDRWADTSAMTEAKRVIRRIAAEASRRIEPQTFTLLRFSRAKHVAQGEPPDVTAVAVDADFSDRLGRLLDPLEASHTAAGPLAAVEAVEQLLGEHGDENRIVYLVSDFRARQWSQAADLRKRLLALSDAGSEIRLVNCVDSARPNLAITSLAPNRGVRAAGVPLFVDVTVKNFGAQAVRDVPIHLAANGRPLPAVNVPQLAVGEAVTSRFPVEFSTAGEHQIVARLYSDAVDVDNVRYGVVDLPADLPVLLIDGDPEAPGAGYVAAALAPGGAVTTGIRPRIETPRYLDLNPLDSFRAVYLMNLDRLNPAAIAALEKYVAGGGGLGVFLGPRTTAATVNEELYRQGKGFFPSPVVGPAELPPDRLHATPDVEMTDHPVFRIFAAGRNSFLGTVTVSRYFAVPDDWQADKATEVIARLRNGAPLVIQRRLGEGRVVAFLTTAAPTWNNWARGNPSFVVTMLELQAYLADNPRQDAEHLVGSPLELTLDPTGYDAVVRFETPGTPAAPAVTVNAAATADGLLAASFAATDTSGFYRAVLAPKAGGPAAGHWAVNVDPAEGDLATIDGPGLAARLEGVNYRYQQAAAYESPTDVPGSQNLGQPLLYALILLLIGEQALAWRTSYHLHKSRHSREGGNPAQSPRRFGFPPSRE